MSKLNIKQLKKELQLSNTKIAEFFDLAPTSFANSTAKKRYEQALCRFYEFLKKHGRNNYFLGGQKYFK